MLLLNQQMGSWENFTETWMKASVRFRTVAVHGLQQCIVPQSAQRRERASECINTLIIQELPKQSRFLISTSQFKVLYKKHLRLHMKTKQHNICEENRATVVDRLMVSCKCQPSSTQLECMHLWQFSYNMLINSLIFVGLWQCSSFTFSHERADTSPARLIPFYSPV